MIVPTPIGIHQAMQESEKATDPNIARAKEKVEKGVLEHHRKLQEHLQLQNEERPQQNVTIRKRETVGVKASDETQSKDATK